MAKVNEAISNIQGIHLKDAFVVVVRTEWNAHVVDLLEQGCLKILKENNIRYKILEVPGAVEIPFIIRQCHQKISEKPDAYIALGCVIKGDTPHFEYVCNTVTDGIMQLNLSLPVPVIFGVLTVNDQMQADERTGGRHGHKGEEAAYTAIKMIALSQSIQNL